MLWEGGAFFETPPPAFEDGMFKPLPPTGARTLDSRTAFYYGYTLDSPGMIMRIPDVGSQYLMAFLDPDGRAVRRGEDLQGDAAQGHPGARLLVVHPLRQPDPLDAGRPRRSTRAPAASPIPRPPPRPAADGSTTVWFGPEQPEGVARGNWIQTDPEKGWFTLLRLYSPLPSFFSKEWRAGEIEMVE